MWTKRPKKDAFLYVIVHILIVVGAQTNQSALFLIHQQPQTRALITGTWNVSLASYLNGVGIFRNHLVRWPTVRSGLLWTGLRGAVAHVVCTRRPPSPPSMLTRAFVQVPVAIHNIREFAVVFKEVVMGRLDADTLSARPECH